MANSKATKKALFTSLLSLLLCFTMLMGATFAWFTDTVTSAKNIIKSGNLDVEMYWAEGDEDPASATWTDASEGAIFDYDLWEPGYVQARHLKIKNVGSLAFKYQLRILADGIVSSLAKVIDVYYVETATQLTRASINNPQTPVVRLGTLSEVLNNSEENPNALTKTIADKLEANKGEESERTLTLAFKMQESAGNEYQNLSIGSEFRVELIATQVEAEADSFGTDYDAESKYPAQTTPTAMVTELTGDELNITATLGIGGSAEPIELDAGFKFEPTEKYDQILGSENAKNHVDFVVYADRTVAANSVALAGYYHEWCQYNNNNWVAMVSNEDIAANQQIRLVELLGATVNYEEICRYGNDGEGFQCGIADLSEDGSNDGTTITVELRMYETKPQDETGSNTANEETGEYTILGTFTYTFGGEYETLADGTRLFSSEDGEVVLYNTAAVTATEYTVPAGVTALGDYSFTNNNTIETVILSNSVESLGRAFDSSTTVKKVVLNEGLEQIDSRAFKATTVLEEVVISSTVKEIADNAFQKSGIKEITIPATVETIGETAFGASLIEKVTIEGNTSIQGYAFRGCTELREVYLNGDDVTFIASTLNGRNSMWFCNGESGNPNTSNITFYVKNETVAARVKTAMGAEASNTNVYVNGVLYEG